MSLLRPQFSNTRDWRNRLDGKGGAGSRLVGFRFYFENLDIRTGFSSHNQLGIIGLILCWGRTQTEFCFRRIILSRLYGWEKRREQQDMESVCLLSVTFQARSVIMWNFLEISFQLPRSLLSDAKSSPILPIIRD